MRWRISAAALRVNVIARMLSGSTPAQQQVDVALDQHPRLAGAGRRFEHDVLRRIDGGPPCGGVSSKVRLQSGPAARVRPRTAIASQTSPT